MRKMLASLAAAAALAAAASVAPTGAQAAPLSGAAALGGAVADADLATPVSSTCWRVWRCGPFGCGFRSVCGWQPGYGFHRPDRAWAYTPPWGARHYGHDWGNPKERYMQRQLRGW